jgi:hypothetical protein
LPRFLAAAVAATEIAAFYRSNKAGIICSRRNSIMNLRFALLILLIPFQARATLTANTSLNGFPAGLALTSINFSSLALASTGDFNLNGNTINLYINTPGAAENFTSPGGQAILGTTPAGEGIVTGALGGVYAPPVINSGGATWSGNYLSTGYGDIVLTFSQPVFGFALLWGSVDPSNELDLLSNGSVKNNAPVLGTVVGTLLGSNIAPSANGSQTYGGSFYTSITSTIGFNQVYLTSNAVSFESADFDLEVPEPGSLLLGSAGIVLIGVRRRSRSFC